MATLWTQTFDFKNKAGMLCMGHDNDNSLLKQAGKFETNFLQSMTWSHRCWFITDIWISDHWPLLEYDTWYRPKIQSQLSVC